MLGSLFKAVNSYRGYQLCRNATLVNFDQKEDLRLFLKLIGDLRIPANVCLNDTEYIANNAYRLTDSDVVFWRKYNVC